MNKKVVIVTGASGGMGNAVIENLSKNYEVFALDIKKPNSLEMNFPAVKIIVLPNSLFSFASNALTPFAKIRTYLFYHFPARVSR